MVCKFDIEGAKQRAEKYCAYRERSPNELFEKILKWGLPREDALSLTAKLSQEGFVDAQRFANAFCNDKFEFNSWGKQKIHARICIHKLPDDVIQNALDQIDMENYKDRLLHLARRKWEKLKNEEEMQRKQKTAVYLIRKGFESELIWESIKPLK